MSERQFTQGKGCNNRKLSDEDRLEIVRLYTTLLPDGTWMGATTLACMFGVRHPTIYRELKRAGVERRSASESHAGKACRPIVNLPTGEAPFCKCGCGTRTEWDRRRNRWAAYAKDHQQDALLWDAAWLREQYVEKRRTTADIAIERGVNASAVAHALRRQGIPARSRSESRMGRKVGVLNPAWKGGVADWDYSSDWRALARRIRDRDAWTCRSCGECRKRWGHALHVHHIDGHKLNNDPGNLISLCARCHRAAHREEVVPNGR